MPKARRVTREVYAAREASLRVELVNAQFDLRDRDFAALILIAGDDRIAANEVVDLLHEWMDARYLETHFFLERSEEERERPAFWRYWRAFPADGRVGVMLGGWTMTTIVERARGLLSDDAYARRLGHVRGLERTLIDDGMLILRFWLHLPRDAHAKRIARAKRSPGKMWQVTEQDGALFEHYDTLIPIAEDVLERTANEDAPWHVIDCRQDMSRDLAVAETIATRLRTRLGEAPIARDRPPAAAGAADSIPDALGALVDAGALDDATYRTRLRRGQARLHRLSIRAREAKTSSVLVFEGWDAAGKGGTIRRLTKAMSARDYVVVPIGAPEDEERRHHYLWRFWRRLPRAGRMVIFDRSWYGRVLVERVERLTPRERWRQAYDEINDFEAQLVEHGWLVQKFWLDVDVEEQARRFRAREQTAYKKYKITDEDYRNRAQRPAYAEAVNEMIARTSTTTTPWTLVCANDKRRARIEVLESVCDGLAGTLDRVASGAKSRSGKKTRGNA